jgi:hypothetical protein
VRKRRTKLQAPASEEGKARESALDDFIRESYRKSE